MPIETPALPSTEPLSPELADERERTLAATDDGALVRYLAKWERKIARLQRAHPERWRVAGLSEDEVRDALTLRLVEAIRTPSAEIEPPPRADREWGLSVAQDHVAALRRRFRLGATPMDLRDATLLERGPTEEERWLEREAEIGRGLAQESAQRALSVPQRRWFAAMKLAARGGAFFHASDELNLSAASRLLGKNRSSAQRAYKELQAHFTRELDRYR